MGSAKVESILENFRLEATGSHINLIMTESSSRVSLVRYTISEP